YRPGTTQAAADSLEVRLFGRGAHGSMPESSIDPVVMAASTVLRLQTIVSREVAASQAAVVTVGALQAGTKENVIPDEAVIKLNVRTFDAGVRKRVLAAVERIVNAEAEASGAPRKPEITTLDHYPLNVNDRDASRRVVEAFRGYFGAERVRETGAAPASEDFGFVRNGVARPFRLLVCRRHRSRYLFKSQGSRPHQRPSGQPQSEVRADYSSYPGDGR
ncbi:MAG: peptidase dimerization domain-containing protein, partial [Bradyrhizobium sp.]